MSPGHIFCHLLRVSSVFAQPITGQVTEVTCPVIGWAQTELTPTKRQKTGPELSWCWAVVICANLSLVWIIRTTTSAARTIRRVQLWAHKPFVKWSLECHITQLTLSKLSVRCDMASTVPTVSFLLCAEWFHLTVNFLSEMNVTVKYVIGITGVPDSVQVSSPVMYQYWISGVEGRQFYAAKCPSRFHWKKFHPDKMMSRV